MAIPTSRKGATRHQLTQMKKFVMENGFGQSIIQVGNEPAIKQLAEEAAHELTIRWRQSSSHTPQGQGSVERFHQTLYLVHNDGMTSYQRRWGIQCKAAMCNFGEVVLADSKPITVNKLDIRQQGKRKKHMAFGWERQPTVASTSLPQWTRQEKNIHKTCDKVDTGVRVGQEGL
eukprot:4055131-Amphidinium_carterae.2